MERAGVATIERQTTAAASKVARTNLKTAVLEASAGHVRVYVPLSLSLSVSLAVAAAQPAQGIMMWTDKRQESKPTNQPDIFSRHLLPLALSRLT